MAFITRVGTESRLGEKGFLFLNQIGDDVRKNFNIEDLWADLGQSWSGGLNLAPTCLLGTKCFPGIGEPGA